MKDREILGEIVRLAAAELLKTSNPTSNEVGDKVLKENPDLLRDMGRSLAERQVYEISARCFRGMGPVREQLSLPLGVPLDIPSVITYPDGADHRHVTIGRAQKWHLDAYHNLLAEQIRADTRKKLAIGKLIEQFALIFEAYPNITVAEAAEIFGKGDDDDQSARPDSPAPNPA